MRKATRNNRWCEVKGFELWGYFENRRVHWSIDGIEYSKDHGLVWKCYRSWRTQLARKLLDLAFNILLPVFEDRLKLTPEEILKMTGHDNEASRVKISSILKRHSPQSSEVPSHNPHKIESPVELRTLEPISQ